mmetsp:Transcript_25281/g.52610  ORF Transcript_25281/g.52610 Transcript_25281/m.52610 type:complete len:664 (-) Transcript_25281:495-2486(-)
MTDTEQRVGDKDGNPISEPGELDVLCGRGGMSNHHPGNEWYRRLIKSNRPLYRACPKHTKLLVSKAIVQAVEQQGGRFLDKNRTDGTWYQVTYKRAVDKTSQGLRERDRDDDNSAAVSPTSAPIITAPPTLGGLANSNGEPRTKVAMKKKQTTFADTTKMSKPDMAEISDAIQTTARDTRTLSPKKRMVEQFQQQVDMPTSKRMRNEHTGGDEDFAPLPPTLQQRESSMFRLLKQTKLLVGQSEHWSGSSSNPMEPRPHPPNGIQQSYPTKLNNLGGAGPIGSPMPNTGAMMGNQNPNNLAFRGKGAQQLDRMAQFQQLEQSMNPQEMLQLQNSGMFGMHPQASLGPPGISSLMSGPYGQAPVAPSPFASAASNQFGAPAPGPYAAAGPGASTGGQANVPALTRLTSQMSDWLTSFWPVPARGESVANPGSRPGDTFGFQSGNGAPAPSAGNMAGSASDNSASNHFSNLAPDATVGANPTTLSHFQKEVAPKLVNVPPPRIDMPPINTIPPISSSRREGAPAPAIGRDSRASRPNKRKSTPGLPEIPMDGATAPAPTELEQSVSATLLKLAGTPSKLYSGISSLFGSNQGAGPTTAQERPAGVAAPPSAMGKRSSASLLDDDDEDEVPVGAGVTGRRSSASLLDDDEDAPMNPGAAGAAWGRR